MRRLLWPGRSIAAKISAAIVAVVTVIVLVRIAHVYLTMQRQLWSDLEVSVAAQADRTAIALELPVRNVDRAQIDRVVESTLRAPEILAIVVVAAGRTHAMTRDASWRPVAFDGRLAAGGLLREDRDVAFGGNRIGAVSVYATPRFAEAKLRATLVASVATGAVVEVVTVTLLWLLLRRIVVVPLRGLERYARAVSAGARPASDAGEARLDREIAALSTSLRQMVAQLDARYAQLAAAESAIHALASRLQVAREEEKARIARDLHDELGQLLTAVQMELRWVEDRLARHPETELANTLTDHVVEATRLAEETAKAVQRIAADLRPSALDQLGLAAALEQEARRFQERTGTRCELSFANGFPVLTAHAASTLYRVAQEALTNVARHAGASRVQVRLDARDGVATLRVEDDGRGLGDVEPGPGALGLLGIRERAAMIGGEVTFAEAGGRGTVVELQVPLGHVVDSRRTAR